MSRLVGRTVVTEGTNHSDNDLHSHGKSKASRRSFRRMKRAAKRSERQEVRSSRNLGRFGGDD